VHIHQRPADPPPARPPPSPPTRIQVPALKAWLRIEPHTERFRTPASGGGETAEQCEAYYFHHYMKHFGDGPIGQAYRTIPQALTFDDHDIFDGWGSYSSQMQNCDVFQTVWRVRTWLRGGCSSRLRQEGGGQGGPASCTSLLAPWRTWPAVRLWAGYCCDEAC
jgi:hypothetical protein